MEGQAISDPLTAPAALLACALGWSLWCLLIGSLAQRLPRTLLRRELWLTGPRPWPESRSRYERALGIHRWKALLPDAGDVLPGGVRKNSLMGRDPEALQRLVEETRRAELVHLALWPFWICTALWLPPAGVLLNLLFATLFNLPCLWLQRYNRLRLEPLLERLRRRRPPA